MLDLYVYYKVANGDTGRLAPLVRTMQAGLLRDTGVQGQLKWRPEEKDGLRTWMEIYPAVDHDFAALLARTAVDAGVDALIAGPRRTEVFTELPPCA